MASLHQSTRTRDKATRALRDASKRIALVTVWRESMASRTQLADDESASRGGTEASRIGFDAAKSGKIPDTCLSPPPLQEDAVVVHISPGGTGLGVFAARDFAAGESILHETAVITADFNERDSRNPKDMRTQEIEIDRVLREEKDAVHLAFPGLLASLGYAPIVPEVEDDDDADGSSTFSVALIGSHLLHGRLNLDRSLTAADYAAHVQPLLQVPAVARGRDMTPAARRAVCRDFFGGYAFQARNQLATPSPLLQRAPQAQSSKSCIYLVTSLINHCHPGPEGPNCAFQIGPGGLTKFAAPSAAVVRAVRDIAAGEELTFNYGKENLGFKCKCPTCGDKRFWRPGGIMAMGPWGKGATA